MPRPRTSTFSARTVRRLLLVTSATVVIVLAACAPAFADDAPPPVRIHAHSENGAKRVAVWMEGADGKLQVVCAPEASGECHAEIPPGSWLRIALEGRAPRSYLVPYDRGTALDIKVLPPPQEKRGSSAATAGGVAMLAVGFTVAAIGGSAVASSVPGGEKDFVAPGVIALIFGSLLGAGGVALLVSASASGGPSGTVLVVTRSEEPRLESTHRLHAVVSSPILPMSYGFTF